MIEAVRNENVLINVKRGCDSLGKHIDDVIVGVCSVVELGAKSILPLLRLHNILGTWRVENKSFKLHLSNSPDFWPHFEREIAIAFVGIGPLDKSHFWIKVWSDLSALDNPFEPVGFVG